MAKDAKHSADEAAIMRAIASMPYGALVHVRVGWKAWWPAPVTLTDVAAYLEALSAVLRDHATTSNQERDELAEIKRDVAGLRRLMFGANKVED